jgi:hypothetical protein
VTLKLSDLLEEMRPQIKADEWRIQLENPGNENRTKHSLVLKMKRERADELLRKVYEVYCDVWQIQGRMKSAPFVRAVYARGIVPVIRSRTQAIASEFAGVATCTGLPVELHNALLHSLRLNMLRLEGRWRRRLEIEAKEYEHSERRKNLNALTSSPENRAQSSAAPQGPPGTEAVREGVIRKIQNPQTFSWQPVRPSQLRTTPTIPEPTSPPISSSAVSQTNGPVYPKTLEVSQSPAAKQPPRAFSQQPPQTQMAGFRTKPSRHHDIQEQQIGKQSKSFFSAIFAYRSELMANRPRQ